MKPVIITRDNRTFEIYVSSIGYGMAEVKVYEIIRPTWKIFRRTFFSQFSTTFFLADYDTIADGVDYCFERAWKRMTQEQSNINKWEEFEKSTKG